MTEVRSRDLLRLAAPLIATNAIQSLLSLTDLWFLGRLSTDAVAALGAIFWIVICLATVLSGVSFVVQSFVSQAVGARRRARASQAAWTGLWAALLAVPLTTALALLGRPLIDALGLQPTTAALAWEFWAPRVLGLPLGLAVWAITSFYNGTGQTLRTLGIAGLAIAANLPLNQWFIFEFGWGMAGAAWATNAAQLLALGAGLAVFLGR
ncbi:MAG: MATE family efflux transporter [Gammaproteobacteria bacterium]|nr:MATE family efflux transporter [Gammaproteobacteria bacterium]